MKRNRIHSLAALLLCLMLCFAMLPVPLALAADITVSGVSVTPSSLKSGGNVTVKGTVKNTVGEEISISISYAEDVKVNKTLAAGESYSFSVTCGVSTSDLGSSNTYVVVDWSSDNHSGSKNVPFKVARQEDEVQLTFTRSISKTTVKAGDSVKLTYSLKNTGSADITNLSIADPAVPDGVASGLSLKAGASKSVSKTITASETVTSTPKATFTAAGGSHTKQVESKKITVSGGDAKLSVSAIVDKALINAGDSVTFTLALRNDSTVAVNNITVTDDQGNAVKSGLSIAASSEGNTKTETFTYQTTLSSPRAVSFKVSYPSGNETKTITSSPVVVNINGQPFISAAPTNVSITATAEPVSLTLPGEVTFTVTVENIGDVALKDVTVSESRLGSIGTFATLGTGEKQTLTKKATVSAPGNYLFQVTAQDGDGMQYSASSANIAISSPTTTATDDKLNPSGGDSLSTLFIIMIVIVVLIIIAGITLAVLVMQEKRAKKRGGPKGGPRPPKGGAPTRSRNGNASRRPQDGPSRRRPPQDLDEEETARLDGPVDEDALPPRRAKMPTIGEEDEDGALSHAALGAAAGAAMAGRTRDEEKYYRRARSNDDGEMTKPFSKKEIEQAKLQLRRQRQGEPEQAPRRRPAAEADRPPQRRPAGQGQSRRPAPQERPSQRKAAPSNRFARDEEDFFSGRQQQAPRKRPAREEEPEFRPRSRRQPDNDPGYGPSNKKRKR